MASGLRGYWDRQEPVIQPGVQPRELTIEDILADIAKVTIGQEQRNPDISPVQFEPTIQVCRDLGTIGLLEQARA
jgi:hypothetical protein